MNELDRLATAGKMIDQAKAPQGMPMAPQGMAPQGMAPQAMAPQGMPMAPGMKKGGSVKAKPKAKPKAYKAGGKVSSASKRADGCAVKGKTKGRMV